MRTSVLVMVLAAITAPALAHPGVTEAWLAAVRQVESGGNPHLVGDGGKAIGPYQIHRGYWKDAMKQDSTIGGTYEDCVDREYAERIIKAYMTMYAPKNATPEQLAKIHNGGPGAMKAKPGTRYARNLAAYWAKVKNAMRRGK